MRHRINISVATVCVNISKNSASSLQGRSDLQFFLVVFYNIKRCAWLNTVYYYRL